MSQLKIHNLEGGGIEVNGKKLRFSVPIFQDYLPPNGMLDEYLETHALFYYYLLAMRQYQEKIESVPIVLEGNPDPQVDFKQLYLSVARMYEVDPEKMANAWHQIDMQCRILGYPPLPDKYRKPIRVQVYIPTR